jgi:thiol-disulfide isomerase/thioredoxin
VTRSQQQLWTDLGRNAAVVLGVAGMVWLLTFVFLDEPLFRVVALILLGGGLLIGVFSRGEFPTRRPQLLRGLVTTCFVVLAAWQWVPPKPEATVAWEPYSVAAIERAAANGQPVIIDFFAEWCPPCHELDRRVFGNKEVAAALEGFVKLRADLTDQNSPANAVISERHAIVALPTVILIGSDGLIARHWAGAAEQVPRPPARGAVRRALVVQDFNVCLGTFNQAGGCAVKRPFSLGGDCAIALDSLFVASFWLPTSGLL